MTRKRASRKAPLIGIPVHTQVALAALADKAAVIGALTSTLTEDFFLLSASLTWALRDLTQGEGPISVGLAHGDYSSAEVEENLEVQISGPLKKIEQEHSRRLVRRVGTFDGGSSEARLNFGNPVKTKLRFVQEDGDTFNCWAYNSSGNPLTTGAFLEIFGMLWGRWIL